MQRPARSLADLQHQLDIFRAYYNNVRPHRALSRQTPIALFNSLIKAKPAGQPAVVDHRVRHDKLDSQGGVTLRYLSRLRHIRVGAAHKNRKVRLLVAGEDVRIITEQGELLRALLSSQIETTTVSRPLACAQCLATGVHDVLRQDNSSDFRQTNPIVPTAAFSRLKKGVAACGGASTIAPTLRVMP